MTTYGIRPQRFSPAPTAMIDFFGALGLRPVPGHPADLSATFVGRSGRVGVHETKSTEAAPEPVPGRTVLSFVTGDVPGEQGAVTSPAGLVIGIQREGGATGSDLRDQVVAASMDVVAICSVADVEREAEFFARFGFEAIEPGEGYLPLTAGPGSGVIGLRRIDDRSSSPFLVDLGVETSEPFDALAARLEAAGYGATPIEDSSGLWIRVVDPDGESLEVRPTR